ncbi:MAG TPA: response regulator [Accumulibacter sp.]|uniref:HD domain-containing phosphohydrolase n=1 Tax=Accumulibacter sp. TaxID=2053492 RepID=UPI000EDC6135|nr:HD domain-containing phosphohydrolase [Accumulibacter sp.]HCZ14624.1 two-component system response regulator [Accumulibacter sp.]HRF73008.1 response regulator [Accumulibacter sp.]
MTEQTSPASPQTLLLVDDEPSILSALRRLFRPCGYRILTSESGAGGLDLLGRENIDLVISDMRMPEMDGAQFLEKVRAGWPRVIRILLTGYADIAATVNAINKGEIYRYISKPWDDNDIVLIVRDALERQQLQNENARLLALTRTQNDELKALNTGLEARVRERTVELEQVNGFLNLANDTLKQSFLVSIKVFSALMELREGSGGGHARRVADMSRKLAIQLGLDAKAQQDVFIAGLLHDIGKIGFSDAMFAKPVPKLNAEELGRYRKHSLAGANALMPLADLKNAADLIRAHHERFDGQGFPDGTAGLGIPLGGRILAVANDYDGLQIGTLSEKHFSAEDAKTLLVKSRGKRYCPTVIDALLELLGAPHEEVGQTARIPVGQLKVGMVLARDLMARDGSLLLAADYRLDANLVREIQAYAKREGLSLVLHIRTTN